MCLCCKCNKVDNTPSSEPLSLEKYLGDWYEIARFNHRFERGISHSKANYSLTDDGRIAVLNTGLKDGVQKVAKGKTKFTDNPRILRVSFFWFFYGDYRILLLDPDYQWALVGGSSDKYLWILSRTPSITQETKDLILTEAQRRGYDIGNLIWVKQ